MKHFKLKDDSVRTKLHLVDTIFNTSRYVEVYVNGCGHTIYRGDNAEEFAAELAAEVDAAEEAHLTKVLKQNIEESEKHALKFIADNSEKPITDIHGKTIDQNKISALYINEFGDVRAILAEDEITTIKVFENTEKDNACIDALAKRCNLYTVINFRLYVDPVSVKKVYIDYDDNDNYVVFVQVYDFDLPAATFDDCNVAMTKLKKLKKAFNL